MYVGPWQEYKLAKLRTDAVQALRDHWSHLTYKAAQHENGHNGDGDGDQDSTASDVDVQKLMTLAPLFAALPVGRVFDATRSARRSKSAEVASTLGSTRTSRSDEPRRGGGAGTGAGAGAGAGSLSRRRAFDAARRSLSSASSTTQYTLRKAPRPGQRGAGGAGGAGFELDKRPVRALPRTPLPAWAHLDSDALQHMSARRNSRRQPAAAGSTDDVQASLAQLPQRYGHNSSGSISHSSSHSRRPPGAGAARSGRGIAMTDASGSGATVMRQGVRKRRSRASRKQSKPTMTVAQEHAARMEKMRQLYNMGGGDKTATSASESATSSSSSAAAASVSAAAAAPVASQAAIAATTATATGVGAAQAPGSQAPGMTSTEAQLLHVINEQARRHQELSQQLERQAQAQAAMQQQLQHVMAGQHQQQPHGYHQPHLQQQAAGVPVPMHAGGGGMPYGMAPPPLYGGYPQQPQPQPQLQPQPYPYGVPPQHQQHYDQLYHQHHQPQLPTAMPHSAAVGRALLQHASAPATSPAVSDASVAPQTQPAAQAQATGAAASEVSNTPHLVPVVTVSDRLVGATTSTTGSGATGVGPAVASTTAGLGGAAPLVPNPALMLGVGTAGAGTQGASVALIATSPMNSNTTLSPLRQHVAARTGGGGGGGGGGVGGAAAAVSPSTNSSSAIARRASPIRVTKAGAPAPAGVDKLLRVFGMADSSTVEKAQPQAQPQHQLQPVPQPRHGQLVPTPVGARQTAMIWDGMQRHPAPPSHQPQQPGIQQQQQQLAMPVGTPDATPWDVSPPHTSGVITNGGTTHEDGGTAAAAAAVTPADGEEEEDDDLEGMEDLLGWTRTLNLDP